MGSVFLSASPFGLFYMLYSNKTYAYFVGTLFCIINYFLYLLNEKVGFLEVLMFKQGCYFGICLFLMMVFEKSDQLNLPDKIMGFDLNNVWSLLF